MPVRGVLPRVRSALAVAVLAGCSARAGPEAGPGPAPASAAAGDTAIVDTMAVDTAALFREFACERSATVTVHVQNRGSTDIQISFGGYTPARAAPGFSRSTYDVARTYLQNTVIRLRILRGGLQTGGPAEIPTENVECNDATLIIGAQPQYSFFYGTTITSQERLD